MDPLIFVMLLLAAAVLLLASASVSRAGDQARTARRLAAIERRVRAVMDHLGVVEPEPVLPQVVTELEGGRKIEAIKVYRDLTGAGLKEAKDAVEAMARDRGL